VFNLGDPVRLVEVGRVGAPRKVVDVLRMNNRRLVSCGGGRYSGGDDTFVHVYEEGKAGRFTDLKVPGKWSPHGLVERAGYLLVMDSRDNAIQV
jgi:hypothetical protein